MPRSLPTNPSLEYLRKQAKALLRAARDGQDEALALFEPPAPPQPRLADAQLALARDYGFASWPKLIAEAERLRPSEPTVHDHVAWFGAFQDLVGNVIEPVSLRDRLDHEVETLLASHSAGVRAATVPLRFYTPGLRDMTADALLERQVSVAEAQEAIAKLYWFDSWDTCSALDRIVDPTFESAADAIVLGELATLDRLLREHPESIENRSPYGHRCTLLHYVSANGVESWRQRTPTNIADITRRLLAAGADPDGSCEAYGGGSGQTPLGFTVSSAHPAEAGLQGDIVEVLLDGGAAINGVADDDVPLATAIEFGYGATAELLVRRGARVRNIVTAAGLGRPDLLAPLLAETSPHPYVDPYGPVLTEPSALLSKAFLLAAKQQHVEIARLLLDAGANVNTTASHARTALHWVAYAGNREMVELILERGGDARLRETYYDATPAGWAREGGHTALSDLLEKAQER